MKDLRLKKITEILPHRQPFIFIDKVIAVEGENKLIAEKTIRKEEDYLKGHFPGNPIVPGVLLIESMAQASGIISAYSTGGEADLYFLTRVSDMKFIKPAIPGDILIIKAEVIRSFGGVVKTSVCCEVNGEVIASGELVLRKMEV